MPFHIIRNDITLVQADAIVNAANQSLLGGGGVDGAVHRAAGPGLLEACRRLGGCRPGEAKLTRGFDLPCRWIIHTVGPVWQGGGRGEAELLRACYENAFRLARQKRCKSLAFPLISAGAYGYPAEQALEIAVQAAADFLEHHDMELTLVVFSRDAFRLGRELDAELREYVDENYVDAHRDTSNRQRQRQAAAQACQDLAGLPAEEAAASEETCFGMQPEVFRPPLQPAKAGKSPAAEKPAKSVAGAPRKPLASGAHGPMAARSAAPAGSLYEALSHLDESFSQMLLRKIDEKGMTDAACYKKANVDRKLFSKIRSDPGYRPSKVTAIAFAIALELPLEETRDLLGKAGFALSRSNRFDVIIEYFITRGNYNIYEINEALFAFDQVLLGA